MTTMWKKNDKDDSAGRLLEYIRSMPPADELADKLEKIVEERKTIRLRSY